MKRLIARLARRFPNLAADVARHFEDEAERSLLSQLVYVLESQGVWAMAVYRFGRWTYQEGPRGAASVPFKATYHALHKAVEVATGVVLPASAEIGPGLLISHPGTIIVHPDTRIGARCSVGQDTTIGTTGRGGDGVPSIGDDVFLGSGCRVLGGVSIGDGASVGANAVVLKDVPAYHTAVGVPAQVVPRRSIVPPVVGLGPSSRGRKGEP